VAEGRDADRLREAFATTKHADVDKNYTRFYTSVYPGIKLSALVDLQDNEGQNVVQTTEVYTIDKAWTWSEQDAKFRFEFYPSSIAALLQKPHDTDRAMPLGIDYPEHQILRTEVILPRTWPSESQAKTITDPAFTYQRNCSCAGNRLVMQYEYQTLADTVGLEAVGQYLKNLDQSSQAMGYTLIWK
jgi:hypothetical protein